MERQDRATVKYTLTHPKTLRGHHGAALSHIKSGVKILAEVEFNDDGVEQHGVLITSPQPFVEFRELEILFNRLDAQAAQVRPFYLVLICSPYAQCPRYVLNLLIVLTASQMVGTPPMLLKPRPRNIAKGFCARVPTAFVSLEQARNSLDYHWNSCTELLNEIEKNAQNGEGIVGNESLDVVKTIGMARQDTLDTFERWRVAFQAYLQNTERHLDSRGLQAARCLEISHSLAIIFLHIIILNVAQDETLWDMFTKRFEHIVSMAASVVDSSIRNKSTQKQTPDFSLDMHTVAPLYAVAHRCRHPIIRRKAVSLLYAAPRQEGVWDSVLTARVAERVIGIEESGLGIITRCEDVPDWARISDVEVTFKAQECQGTIKYSRQRSPLEKVRDSVVDVIRW